jgi:biopolymer transport protein ExbB/TolQ
MNLVNATLFEKYVDPSLKVSIYGFLLNSCAENARVREQAEKVKKDLAKIKSASQNIPEAESKWTHHHSAPGKKIKNFIETEKKMHGEDCSCDKIDMETSRTKMNHAIQGLKEAIQRHNSGNGTTIKSGDRTLPQSPRKETLRDHQICG